MKKDTPTNHTSQQNLVKTAHDISSQNSPHARVRPTEAAPFSHSYSQSRTQTTNPARQHDN